MLEWVSLSCGPATRVSPLVSPNIAHVSPFRQLYSTWLRLLIYNSSHSCCCSSVLSLHWGVSPLMFSPHAYAYYVPTVVSLTHVLTSTGYEPSLTAKPSYPLSSKTPLPLSPSHLFHVFQPWSIMHQQLHQPEQLCWLGLGGWGHCLPQWFLKSLSWPKQNHLHHTWCHQNWPHWDLWGKGHWLAPQDHLSQPTCQTQGSQHSPT